MTCDLRSLKMGSFIAGIFVFVLLKDCVLSQLIKKWVPNTNFENPDNWNVGRQPCRNDVVHFPRNSGTVYVQTNASFQEVVLPINGELVLANYMSFSFPSPQNDDPNCYGQEVTYNGTTARSWYDPENWCEVSDPEGSCMAEVWPRLDTEKLPCENDQAVFPSGAGFHVDLEAGVDIYLGKLTIRGKEYITGQFKSYLGSDRGKQEFERSPGRGATSVNVQGQMCYDQTGCPCGNDGGILEQKVCANQGSRCADISCNGPLLPQGHCCHICGSVMLLDYGAGFKYKGLENIIHNSVPRAQRRSVHVMVSRLHTEQVQVVVHDVDGTNQVSQVVEAIRRKIQPDHMGNSRYRITNIQLTSSDGGTGPGKQQAQTDKAKKMTAGSIASVVIAILVVIAIIVIAMFCLIDRRRPSTGRRNIHLPTLSWPFRRHTDEGGSMELGASVGFKDNIVMYGGAEDTLRGFENPTYENNTATMNGQSAEQLAEPSNNNAAPISTIDLSQPTFVKTEQDPGFSNPMYGNPLKVEDLSYLDSSVKLNPVFSTEGLEEDSEI